MMGCPVGGIHLENPQWFLCDMPLTYSCVLGSWSSILISESPSFNAFCICWLVCLTLWLPTVFLNLQLNNILWFLTMLQIYFSRLIEKQFLFWFTINRSVGIYSALSAEYKCPCLKLHFHERILSGYIEIWTSLPEK